MSLTFTKATKQQARGRIALVGPSGSGKTYTALVLASAMGKSIALIDTERGSASKYADIFNFDTLQLETFSPELYVQALEAASGYDVIVIDSLSHAWMGKDGALEQVDMAAKRSKSQNSFMAWREVTQRHNALVDAILRSPAHVVATMRAKTEYVLEKDANDKTVPRKVGMAPIQRDGVEYEFDIVADMDLENNFIVSKSRMQGLNGQIIPKPAADLGRKIMAWLSEGEPAKPSQQQSNILSRIAAARATFMEMSAEAKYDQIIQEYGEVQDVASIPEHLQAKVLAEISKEYAAMKTMIANEAKEAADARKVSAPPAVSHEPRKPSGELFEKAA